MVAGQMRAELLQEMRALHRTRTLMMLPFLSPAKRCSLPTHLLWSLTCAGCFIPAIIVGGQQRDQRLKLNKSLV